MHDMSTNIKFNTKNYAAVIVIIVRLVPQRMDYVGCFSILQNVASVTSDNLHKFVNEILLASTSLSSNENVQYNYYQLYDYFSIKIV